MPAASDGELDADPLGLGEAFDGALDREHPSDARVLALAPGLADDLPAALGDLDPTGLDAACGGDGLVLLTPRDDRKHRSEDPTRNAPGILHAGEDRGRLEEALKASGPTRTPRRGAHETGRYADLLKELEPVRGRRFTKLGR